MSTTNTAADRKTALRLVLECIRAPAPNARFRARAAELARKHDLTAEDLLCYAAGLSSVRNELRSDAPDGMLTGVNLASAPALSRPSW